MKGHILTICGFFVSLSFLHGQCNINNNSFQSGEDAQYNVYYHLGFIWLHAANVSFKTKAISYNGTKAYHFISVGKTLPSYSWIYEVNDHFESKADSATLNPFWFYKYTSEGNNTSYNKYVFDPQNPNIYIQTQTNKKQIKYDTIITKTCVFDLLTAIYACRNFNFQNMKINDTVPINLLIEDSIYSLHLRYLGNDIISNADSKKYRCQKFSILLVEGTIFNGGENMIVWVTDDKARVPIRIEAEILIGSIVANMASYKGNKWPLDAEVLKQ